MKNYSFEQKAFIEKYFTIGSPSKKGWCKNNQGCPYCHDGRSKNPRSHFLFDSNEIGFQCFNCGKKHRFNNKNVNSLANFIAKAVWKKPGSILLELKKNPIFEKTSITEQEDLSVEDTAILELLNYKEVELPDLCIPFKFKESQVAGKYKKIFTANKSKAKEYLIDHAVLEISKKKKLFICVEGDYKNRLIIPIYFDGKMVSWVARALFPTKTKFLYPPSDEDKFNDRGNIIYGLDKLFSSDVKQILVTESIIDAWIFNGIAILSKNITDNQIKILENFNSSRKKLLFVLDKDKIDIKYDKDLKGIDLGKKILSMLKEEWLVSYPKFSKPAKDISESTSKFGILETYDKIMEGIVNDKMELTLKSKLANVKIRNRFK